MIATGKGLEDTVEEVERNGSDGEKQIARMLERYGVRYLYEYPLAVKDRGKVRVWYPDFWLPDYGVFMEYVGNLKNEDYASGIRHKKAVYRDAGVPCLFVEENDFHGDWPKRIFGQVRESLYGRLEKLDSVDRKYF